jgi:hypothetical protein
MLNRKTISTSLISIYISPHNHHRRGTSTGKPEDRTSRAVLKNNGHSGLGVVSF